jgi:hypothetical protein
MLCNVTNFQTIQHLPFLPGHSVTLVQLIHMTIIIYPLSGGVLSPADNLLFCLVLCPLHIYSHFQPSSFLYENVDRHPVPIYLRGSEIKGIE